MTVALEIPTAADRDALVAAARDTFTETFGTLYAPADLAAFLADAFGPTGLPSQIGDPAFPMRVHRDGDTITGFVKLGPPALPVPNPLPGAMELRQLYIRKPWQGAGVAQAMMDWALAEARARGASALYLTVYVDNLRAKRFYARYGFVEVGRYEFKVGNHVDDDRIWMLKL